MNEKFNLIGFHSQLMQENTAQRILSDYKPTFSDLGLEISSSKIKNEKLSVYFILSGGSEHPTLNYINQNHNTDFPIILLAHPAENSLPAALEILAKLRLENRKGRIIFFNEPRDSNAIDELRDNLHSISVYQKLANSKIGLIGDPSDWLVSSSQNPEMISENWKCKIEKTEIEELRKIYLNDTASDHSVLLSNFKDNAKSIVEPFENEISDGIKVYTSLKKIIEKKEYHACTIRCFDLVIKDKTTGCYALSKLTDDGIISGCEGDLPSLIGMYWSKLMTGNTPWMANPSSVDIMTSTIKLAHCTIARSLTESYEIRSHFESGIGIGIQGEVKPGNVTLLRLGGKDLKSIWVAEGKIKWSGNLENLCRTQVDIVINDKNSLSDLLKNPLGNHIVMVHGSHKDMLLKWHNEFIK